MDDRKWRMPPTYLGFPVAPEDARDDEGRGERKKTRGVALIIAILVIAMMMIFTSDMIINSTVNLQLSVAGRDNVKAEYMAKSGMNLALFLLSLDFGQDLFLYQTQKKVPTDAPGDYWDMVNGYPIGGETVEMLSQVQENFDLSAVNDSGVIDQLKLFDGQFSIIVSDEAAKLNLNYCAKGRGDPCTDMLKDLFSCPAEKEFLNRKKVRPGELVAAIKDWVDLDTAVTQGANYASEGDPYNNRVPKVSPKNAPMDSVDELKLVAGWDDDLHTIFSPYFTVFPVIVTGVRDDLKININTVDDALLSCLLPQTNQQCAERALPFQNQLDSDGNEVPPDAISNQGEIVQRLTDKYCETDNKRSKYFTFRSDVFRIEAAGLVGDQEKTIQAVVLREMPDKNDQKNGYKATYKLLYWKMI